MVASTAARSRSVMADAQLELLNFLEQPDNTNTTLKRIAGMFGTLLKSFCLPEQVDTIVAGQPQSASDGEGEEKTSSLFPQVDEGGLNRPLAAQLASRYSGSASSWRVPGRLPDRR